MALCSMPGCMCHVSGIQARRERVRTNHPLADITNFIFENPTMLNLKMTGFWVSDREYHALMYLL